MNTTMTGSNKTANFLAFTISLFMTLILSTSAAFAANGVFSTSSGVAIEGYDTVAYFTESKAVKGKKEFTVDHQGNKWQFSTAANKQAFIANPTAYLPQYGGYCAYAASKNSIAPIDPKAWTIDNNKLYLNYNFSVRKTWLKKKTERITNADKNWPELRKQVL